MASRKDNKGRVLRKGEFQRASDGKYVYGYTDPNGVRRYIYSKDLKKLREREDKLVKDQLDGLDVYVAGSADITNAVDVVMAYERNYDRFDFDPSKIHDAYLSVTKNRLTGRLTGKSKIGLFYSESSKRITSQSSVAKNYSWELDGEDFVDLGNG